MKFVNHDGTHWPQNGQGSYYSSNDRGSFDSFFVIRKINLTASAKTFKLQFQSAGGGGSASEYKGLRIFAFRADGFDSVEGVEDVAETSNNTTTSVDKSSLTTSTPPGSRKYIAIQSIWVYDTDTGTTHPNNAEFTMDGTVLSSQDHVLDRGNSYQFASACVHSFTTSSAVTLKNRFSSGTAAVNTYSKESVIYVLRYQ